jgi:hypothetical protein
VKNGTALRSSFSDQKDPSAPVRTAHSGPGTSGSRHLARSARSAATRSRGVGDLCDRAVNSRFPGVPCPRTNGAVTLAVPSTGTEFRLAGLLEALRTRPGRLGAPAGDGCSWRSA